LKAAFISAGDQPPYLLKVASPESFSSFGGSQRPFALRSLKKKG
jgi:hypothetical protein